MSGQISGHQPLQAALQLSICAYTIAASQSEASLCFASCHRVTSDFIHVFLVSIK